MKFANLSIADKQTIAVVDTEQALFWPVASLIPGFAGDMIELVKSYAEYKSALHPTTAGQPLSDAIILAPIDAPRRNIFCVGKNYHEHATESMKPMDRS